MVPPKLPQLLIATTQFGGNNSWIDNPTQVADILVKSWLGEALDKGQMVICIIGILANVATVLTLRVNGQDFTDAIKILFQHQSIIDALVCIDSLVFLLWPDNFAVGFQPLNVLICLLHHSYFFMGFAVFLSVWNLVFLSCERFLAVCHPFRHSNLTASKLLKALFVLYIIAFVVMSPYFFLHVKIEGKECLGQPIDIELGYLVLKYYCIVSFILWYSLPCILFLVFYGLVIYTLQKRKKQSGLGSSKVIVSAANELTKTAIVVTFIFIFAIGCDCWTYLLGNWELINYKLGEPLHRVVLWLLAFNSGANPFIYVTLIPMYRRSILKTFCCKGSNN